MRQADLSKNSEMALERKLDYAYRKNPTSLVALKFEHGDEFYKCLQYFSEHDVEYDIAGGRTVILLKI